MNITTALKRRDQAIQSLRDLYARAAEDGLPSSQINDEYNVILARLVKCPLWIRAYLDGYRAALTENAYRTQLVYGAFIEGKFYSTHRNRDDYYEKQGLSPSIFAEKHDKAIAGHYWAKNLRPFFVSSN